MYNICAWAHAFHHAPALVGSVQELLVQFLHHLFMHTCMVKTMIMFYVLSVDSLEDPSVAACSSDSITLAKPFPCMACQHGITPLTHVKPSVHVAVRAYA